MFKSEGYNRFTAPEVGIDIVGDKAHFQISCAAQSPRASSGYIEIFRKHKFDAFHQYIAASRAVMSGDGESFHAALVFFSFTVHLCQDHGECHTCPAGSCFEYFRRMPPVFKECLKKCLWKIAYFAGANMASCGKKLSETLWYIVCWKQGNA